MIQSKYRLSLCLVLAIGSILLVVALGMLQRSNGIFDGADELAIQTAKTLRSSPLTFLMKAVTSLGDEMGLMPVVCVVFWLGYTTEAIFFLLLLLFGNIVNSRLKDYFELSRPSEMRIEWLSEADGYGFPSGHSQNGMFYSWLVYSFVRDYWYVCLIPALLMAASRIYLGVHFFSDTVGGLISGFGIVAAGAGIYSYVSDLHSLRESTRRSRFLKIVLSFTLSAVYLACAWGQTNAFKYAGFLAGFFIVYSMLGFRWRSRGLAHIVIVAVVGMAVLLSIRMGLSKLLPRTELSNYLRYFLTGIVLAGSPFVFVKVGLLKGIEEKEAFEKAGDVASE